VKHCAAIRRHSVAGWNRRARRARVREAKQARDTATFRWEQGQLRKATPRSLACRRGSLLALKRHKANKSANCKFSIAYLQLILAHQRFRVLPPSTGAWLSLPRVRVAVGRSAAVSGRRRCAWLAIGGILYAVGAGCAAGAVAAAVGGQARRKRWVTASAGRWSRR
jgi:hypothetical protein